MTDPRSPPDQFRYLMSGTQQAMSDHKNEHLQQMPYWKDEVDRAFGFLAEKRCHQDSDHLTGCTSYIQRKLQCGYNRAATLLDMMVEQKWITEPDQNGARRLLKPLA